jgi:hypothetical protein
MYALVPATRHPVTPAHRLTANLLLLGDASTDVRRVVPAASDGTAMTQYEWTGRTFSSDWGAKDNWDPTHGRPRSQVHQPRDRQPAG